MCLFMIHFHHKMFLVDNMENTLYINVADDISTEDTFIQFVKKINRYIKSIRFVFVEFKTYLVELFSNINVYSNPPTSNYIMKSFKSSVNTDFLNVLMRAL